MSLNVISKQIKTLQDSCEPFLNIYKMSDEEKQKLIQKPLPLQIQAFDNIINECKEEITTSSIEKITGVLHLLYKITIKPFDPNSISVAMEDFISNQLLCEDSGISEQKLLQMKNIVQDITNIQLSLVSMINKLNKDAKKWYVFNSSKRKKLSQLYKSLNETKNNINLQLEFDAKKISAKVVDDFYNTFIFFAYLTRISIIFKEELLCIELTSFLDRYIKVIELVFNGRHLKSEDMIYYYIIYELNGLKNIIYERTLQEKIAI